MLMENGLTSKIKKKSKLDGNYLYTEVVAVGDV